MEQINELAAVRADRRSGTAKLTRKLGKLAQTALDCLEEILTDDSAKPADRISAVKLTFELMRQQPQKPDEDDGVIKVVFEGIPRELAE